ncbi:MAG TPA: sigma-70 family RNA polymerase sigma factor [Vicinamibacterales bacterium]|nr:sigma-70 family RNA polymerase sigma factor [Vicinamibacterales bacterium]
MDEAELAVGIRAGDERAYEALVRSEAGRLFAVTRRILGNDEDARDAVQEAFISAFKARGQFGGGSKVSTWIHRIAVNAALSKLRSRRRHPEENIDDLLPRFLPNGHHTERFTSWTEPADQIVARKETAELVRRTIDQLPESFRMAVLLRDIEGMSTDEAAQMLGTTANALKLRLHRARLALRTLLAPHFGGTTA